VAIVAVAAAIVARAVMAADATVTVDRAASVAIGIAARAASPKAASATTAPRPSSLLRS
jgi:hypothetical protein